MKKKFLTLYCTLDNILLRNGEVVSRLNFSGFKQVKDKPNLYYKTIHWANLERSQINISYYYYVDGVRKVSNNAQFDILTKRLLATKEQMLRQKAFNDANGYTEEYFQSLTRDFQDRNPIIA